MARRFSMLAMIGTERTKEIMDVGLGRKAADLALINGTVLNVYTAELLEGQSVLIKGEWIAQVGRPPEGAVGPETRVVDVGGRFIIPGLIDTHTHLADSVYSPAEFLRRAMIGGTTTTVTETIEPYPIRGVQGVVEFLECFRDQPVKVYGTAPSMASTSSRSHGISREDLASLLARDDVLGLGEAYWQAVFQDPDTFLPRFEETLLAGKRLEGHSAGAKGPLLTAYAASGISSCHEPISAQDALELLRSGIYVMAREGSIRRDLQALAGLKDTGADLRRLILVTDGIGPADLYHGGYMEQVVQKAVDSGFPPVQAIQMATLNPATYFHLDGFVGGLAPGRQADMVVLSDLQRIRAEIVVSRGRIVAESGRLLVSPRSYTFSPESLDSISLPRELVPDDFRIRIQAASGSAVKVRVIDQVTELVTREAVVTMTAKNGEIRADPSRDLLKVAAVDRGHHPYEMFTALIRGFHMKAGALASSSAWDTSDIIVVGQNDEDMAEAVNRIRRLRGGAVLTVQGRVMEEIPLPILGLMSNLPLGELATRMERLGAHMKELGFPFKDPYRTLSTLTGAAIPFLRISEEGLRDIKTGRRVSLVVENS